MKSEYTAIAEEIGKDLVCEGCPSGIKICVKVDGDKNKFCEFYRGSTYHKKIFRVKCVLEDN